MPRKPREEFEPGIFHVFARGNAKAAIFRDDKDRERYLRILELTVRRCHWSCLAYCLMTNHVHLLLETRHTNLGNGMGRLHGEYAQWFNREHDRSGHLFESRFGDRRILTDEHFVTELRYVVRNPLEAMMCDRLEDHPWSSHHAMVGTGSCRWLDRHRVTQLIAGDGADPLRRYLEIVES